MARLVIGEVEMSAVDYGGLEVPLFYIPEEPEVEAEPGWRPTLLCPECVDSNLKNPGVLRRGLGVGANNSVNFHCPLCSVKYKRSDSMEPRIYLEWA